MNNSLSRFATAPPEEEPFSKPRDISGGRRGVRGAVEGGRGAHLMDIDARLKPQNNEVVGYAD